MKRAVTVISPLASMVVLRASGDCTGPSQCEKRHPARGVASNSTVLPYVASLTKIPPLAEV